MMKISCKSMIKRLSVYSILLLLAGCAGTRAAWDIYSCSQRGGEVVNKCTYWNPHDIYNCRGYENICVGGMTHEQFEELNNPVYVPLPELSDEEKARKKMQYWDKRLDKYATKEELTRDADKYPKISWLSSRWCLKGSNSNKPVNFYNVTQTGIGSLNIDYNDIDVDFKQFTHVKITGNYYDLWDGSGYSQDLRDEHGRRLVKYSDEEFSLVYKFKRAYGEKYYSKISNRWSDAGIEKYTKGRALEIGPEQHIKNPEVYVKCE